MIDDTIEIGRELDSFEKVKNSSNFGVCWIELE
jgi:hypothetical protein